MTGSQANNRAGPICLARRIIEVWALFGGLVLVAVVLVNAYSILSGALFNRPFSGDFELTEMGTAIAIFCFLPYCQITGSNVTADIFTVNASRRTIALMSMLASVAAIGFSALLVWRMSYGLSDYIRYTEITGILSIPIWWAFVPALISLALLVLASVITLRDAAAGLTNQSEH